MGNCDTCIETVRNGGHYYLLDAKDYSQGPMVGLPKDEYAARLEKVKLSGDSRAMFDSSSQHDTLSDGELTAHAAYAIAGLLDHLDEKQQVIAYENPDLAPPGVVLG